MRNCLNCGLSIVAKNAQARTCSTRCRVAYHRKTKGVYIPEMMLTRSRWIRRDRNKIPLTVDGYSASSTNSKTWASFSDANNSTVGIGLGFVLGEGIGCIDLDHCLVDGKPNDEAQKFLNQYPNSFIEISPSGDGLHIWGLRSEQKGVRTKVKNLSVEVYSTGRYITVTGRVFQPGGLVPINI